MKFCSLLCATSLLALGSALDKRESPTTTAPVAPTAVSECHLHESTQFCMAGATEYEIDLPATATLTALPEEYTDCHSHGSELFCVDDEGNDVGIHLADEEGEGEEHEHDEDHDHDAEASTGTNCHFHAGVEHCTGGEAEEASSVSCERTDREYNVTIRIGFLFIMLATSAIGVFSPIIIQKVLPNKLRIIFTVLKQFGTGIIISTAFVHLYTHSTLMFENQCLASMIEYESTPAAILMAGIFISFLVEYLGQRFVRRQAAKNETNADLYHKTEMVNIMVLEAGIIFHSLLIGLTLVVAGDSFFKTLFIVIVFHQMFEGVALGSRIADLGTAPHVLPVHRKAADVGILATVTTEEDKHPISDQQSQEASSVDEGSIKRSHVSTAKKLLLALAFAVITPAGMGIGIGVLHNFNGNDPATLIAIGTLDALSAGILVWVGVVEMWAEDWMHGELADAGIWTTTLSFVGLIGGMVLMSLLGKWA